MTMAAWLAKRLITSPAGAARRTMVTGKSRVPSGQRIYAIGDIHGRFDLASRMFETIRAEIRELDHPTETVVIGLGDYIDRGPDSRQVLDLMCEIQEDPLFRFIGLMGNHEAMLIALLNRPGPEIEDWLSFGGVETLVSYNIAGAVHRDPRRVREAMARCLPVEQLLFLQRLRKSIAIGDYFFCHAGARPGIALAAQKDADLMWIGNGFSDADHEFEKVIVHGHSRVPAADIRRHRINLDTGAYITGLLSAVVLEGSSIRLLSCRLEQGSSHE